MSNQFTEEQDDLLTEQVDSLAQYCKENDLTMSDHKSSKGNYLIEIRPQ